LDDLHWADPAALLMLRHLVAATTAERLVIVMTYRESELSDDHPLLHSLAAIEREANVSRLQLDGLERADIVSLMESMDTGSLPAGEPELVDYLHRETSGNAFFVVEMLRHLSSARARALAAGDPVDEPLGECGVLHEPERSIPGSVRDSIGARVARFGPDDANVLSAASVIGREFESDLLASVSQRTPDQLLDLLERATTAALVTEVADRPGRYAFQHSLIQRVLYDRMSSARRAHLHRRIAEALESSDPPGVEQHAGELVHHWIRAGQPFDAARILDYAQAAAEQASALLAPEDAVRYYELALDFWGRQSDPDPLLWIDLNLALGEAQRLAGIPAFRETLLGAAHRAHEERATARLVAAALANNRGFFSASGVVDAEKIEVLRTALSELSDSDSTARALLLATLCNELSFGSPLVDRQELAEEASGMARRIGDSSTLQQVLVLIDMPRQVPALLTDRLTDASEALMLARASRDPDLQFWAAAHCRMDAIQAGDLQLATSCLEIMHTLGAELHRPTLLWTTAFCDAADALIKGDPSDAEQKAEAALQIGVDSGQPDAFALYAGQLSWARFQQGLLGEIETMIEQVTVENPGIPAFSGFLALTHLEAGHPDLAQGLLADETAKRFSSLPQDFMWMIGIANYALVAMELQAAEAAAVLVEMLQPYETQIPYIGASVTDSVAFYLGGLAAVLGRFDEAEGYFMQASVTNALFERRFCEAQTCLAWGRTLTRSGDGANLARGMALLQQARDSGRQFGYGAIERRAAAELDLHF
jgi:hypothetical protein